MDTGFKDVKEQMKEGFDGVNDKMDDGFSDLKDKMEKNENSNVFRALHSNNLHAKTHKT